MTPIEAMKIIEKFHESIIDLRPDAIVLPDTSLPYTSGLIKYAHFVLGEKFTEGTVPKSGIVTLLTESYGIIDLFFVEDPDLINKKYREFISGLRKGVVIDFQMPNPFGNPAQVLEYYNFLGERLHEQCQVSISKIYENEGDVLPTFVYNELYNKHLKEKNVKGLIEIVNTSLTRSVNFPGKKSNSESIVIKPN